MSEGTNKEENREENFEEKIEKAMEQIIASPDRGDGQGEESEKKAQEPQSQDISKQESQAQKTPLQESQGQEPPVSPVRRKAPTMPPPPPPKRRNPAARITGTLLGALVLCSVGGYLGMSYYYSNKFFPGTTINSFDCSELTVAQCEELIRKKVEDYSLTVASRGHDPQVITAESIRYKYKSDGAIEKAMEDQKPWKWVKGYIFDQSYSAGENITYDKDLVKEQLEALECMKPENQIQPRDAYIEFQDTLFAIVPGEEGSAINEEVALNSLYTAIDNTEENVDFEKAGAYLQPNVREDDEGLMERLKIVNTYAKASVTHVFGDETEVLDSKTFKDWYSKDQNGDLYLDGEVLRSKLQEYVADMAYRHNTLGATRTFTATDGRTVEVSGGNYGWQISQYDEVEKMYQEILTGEQVSREPVYSSYGSAWSGGSDIGSTYVEVDLSNQHMYFYRDGAVIMESDFVSGNMSYDDRKTPEGVCHIVYKTKDFTLRGEKKEDGTYEYEEPVSYWMPFNGGVGFHDAPWRGEFGGNIYKTSGSHGCINMPFDKAAELYDLIDESVPIVVFY